VAWTAGVLGSLDPGRNQKIDPATLDPFNTGPRPQAKWLLILKTPLARLCALRSWLMSSLEPPTTKAMAAFYKDFLGGHASHENEVLSFITYDDEYHRIAIAQLPFLKPKDKDICGLEVSDDDAQGCVQQN
jgi:hypothetical protein